MEQQLVLQVNSSFAAIDFEGEKKESKTASKMAVLKGEFVIQIR